MTRTVIILALSCLAINGDALVLTQEERSVNTIASASMSKMQTEAVRVIAEGIKHQAEKAATGELIIQSRTGHNDVRGVLESARAFLVDKRKQIRVYRNSQRANRTKGHHLGDRNETCAGWCIAGIIIDSLFILGNDNNNRNCGGPLVMVVWLVQGMVTLMMDQGLDFDEALFMLTQQITTIGYGSSTPDTQGMRLFHALHSVVGVAMAAQYPNEMLDAVASRMVNYMTDRAKRIPNAFMQRLAINMPLTLTVIAITCGYAADLKASDDSYTTYAKALLDSFYMTLITLTTVGYGDLNPGTFVGKVMSLPVMYFGTRLFTKTFENVNPHAEAEEEEEAKSSDTKSGSHSCQCIFFRLRCGRVQPSDSDSSMRVSMRV